MNLKSSLLKIASCIKWLTILSVAMLHAQSGIAQNDTAAKQSLFQDQTIESGLLFEHRQVSKTLSSFAESLGGGGCLIDFDLDGKLDLYLLGGTGATRYYGRRAWWQTRGGNKLYKNVTQEKDRPRFKEVTEEAGLIHIGWGMRCVAGDLDNDGDSDLVVTQKGADLIYENMGDGRFKPIAVPPLMQKSGWSTDVKLIDVNADGRLDIYIGRFIDFDKRARTFEAQRGFKMDGGPYFRPELYDALPNQLFINLGDWIFEERAQMYGLNDPAGRTLQTVWLNRRIFSNRPDVVILNGAQSPSRYLRFDTDRGQYVEADAAPSGGVAGLSTGALFSTGDLLLGGVRGTPPQWLTYEGGAWHDLALERGIATEAMQGATSWDIAVLDINGDAIDDIIFANGAIAPDPLAPTLPQGQANKVLLGGELSRSVTEPAFSWARYQSSRTILSADFDGDGDIDLVFTANNGPVSLWNNLNEAGDLSTEGQTVDDFSSLTPFLPSYWQWRLAAEERPQMRLSLLKEALQILPAVQRVALQWIKKLEWEWSLYWLLELLESPSQSVDTLCDITEVASHFFQEEEAVVRRKYLLVSPLLRRLNDLERQIAQRNRVNTVEIDMLNDKMACLFEALGDSEHYRGTYAAQRNLGAQAPQVRAMAARALGLSRHHAGLDTLISKLSAERDPDVWVAMAVALARLDHTKFTEAFDTLLSEWHRRGNYMEIYRAAAMNPEAVSVLEKMDAYGQESRELHSIGIEREAREVEEGRVDSDLFSLFRSRQLSDKKRVLVLLRDRKTLERRFPSICESYAVAVDKQGVAALRQYESWLINISEDAVRQWNYGKSVLSCMRVVAGSEKINDRKRRWINDSTLSLEFRIAVADTLAERAPAEMVDWFQTLSKNMRRTEEPKKVRKTGKVDRGEQIQKSELSGEE